MALFLAVTLTASVVPRSKPHIIHMLADDLGWSEVGYHRTQDKGDASTPNIDRILTEGLELNRYVSSAAANTRTIRWFRLCIILPARNVCTVQMAWQ